LTEKTSEPNSTTPSVSGSVPSRAARSAQPSVVEAVHGHEEKKTARQDSSYQNYLFGSAGSTENPAWSDSIKGRAAIRLVSRGIVGAAFFTIGGRMARNQMVGYTPEKWDTSKPLQWIAKGFDLTLGKGIETAVRVVARTRHTPLEAAQIARQAVTFRPSLTVQTNGINGAMIQGRSYGSDIVHFTFDFAMASIGDAGTRNIIQALDPNVKKAWLVNDAGDPAARGEKKHFLAGEWAKSVAKTSWRVLSKNQGEDWAAAIPYAFQMKFQRQFLSNIHKKRFAGHELVFDNSWNGGAYRVNPAGKVVGDYQLVGAVDLHARFVGYNWYTLMFREGYDTVGNAFKKWKEDGFAIHPHLPEHFNPLTSVVDGIGQSMRYVTKSFIKANMYMNPAVVPFWLFRVPQSKWRAGTVNPEAAESQQLMKASVTEPYSKAHYSGYEQKTALDRFETGFSKFLHPIGEFCYNRGTNATNLSDKLAAKGWWPKGRWFNNISKTPGLNEMQSRHHFVREYVDASLSYTPYMFAKAEAGLRVDDSKGDGKPGEMDKAIYRFMDDVAAFKLGSVGGDLKHMWRLGTNFEREVNAREGADVKTQEMVKKHAPVTTVYANSVQRHDLVNLNHDTPREEKSETADNRWVAALNRDINPAQLHPATATRH
jgi:hypothetical protein